MAKTILAIILLSGGAGACSSPASPAHRAGPVVPPVAEPAPIPTTTEPPPTPTEPPPPTTEPPPPTTEAPPPPTVPTIRARSAPSTAPATSAPATTTAATGSYAVLLACIRSHEQGADGYATDTGNGYYGAYQFELGTWLSVGGTGSPADASPAEQDARAWALYQSRGLQPWPTPNRLCQWARP